MSEYYIGTMCGTSLDSLDISLVRITSKTLSVRSFKTFLFPSSLKRKIVKSISTNNSSLIVNNELSEFVSSCITKVIKRNKLDVKKIRSIGFPGITLYHDPKKKRSDYLGCPKLINKQLGIPVIADFRLTDIMAGGQGAPMAGYFHDYIIQKSTKPLSFLNLGGFANLTIKISGKLYSYDSGPANYLLDYWCKKKFRKEFDRKGLLAKSGSINYKLLKILSSDIFFKKKYPKSTGFERFNDKWLQNKLSKLDCKISNIDVLTTLTYLTITTVSQQLNKDTSSEKNIYIYGGGVNNETLVTGILNNIKHKRIKKIRFNLDEKNLESVAFAWMAHQRIKGIKIGKSTITGKKRKSLLGTIYDSA